MRPGRRRVAGGLLVVVLAGGVLAWLVDSPQGAVLGQRAASLGALGWTAAVAGLLSSYALRAARVFLEWRHRHPLRPADSLWVVLVHTAAVNLLPMRSGELGYPVALNRRAGIPLPDAALSLAWMRLQDLLVVAWLAGLTASAWLFARDALQAAPALALALAISAGFVLGAARAGGIAAALFGRLRAATAGGARTSRWRGAVERACVAAHAAAGRQSHATWMLCVANWVVKLGTLAVLLQALAALSPFAAWCGALGGDTAAALPVQPAAGFGTYEAGVALAATLAGAPGWADVLGAALVVHVFMVACSSLAALAMVLPLARSGPPAACTAARRAGGEA